MSQQYGGPYANLDLSRIIVPGHEYVGEILDYGPGSRRPLKVGSMVTSAPVMRHAGGHSIIGQSHDRSEERRVGKSVAVRVDLGGRRIIKKKQNNKYR